MKIEVAESLMYSWLKHVKKCHVVQLNWKTSVKWQKHHSEDINQIITEMNEKFDNVFKKNVSSQLLSQGEIDVLGVNLDNKNIYAADVAFHTFGLRYSDNLLKISEKLVLKGYKDIDGKEVYVLKGMLSNNAIINRINEMIESNIYNLPAQYGQLTYEVYVNRETYEIIGMDIDLSNVIKTLAQLENEVSNIIKVRFELNKITKLPTVEVRKAGLDNFSQIWTFMQYYTNVMNGLKK